MKIKELEPICQKILEDQAKAVKEYKGGKIGLIGMFCSQIMIETKSKVDPKEIMVILKEKLK